VFEEIELLDSKALTKIQSIILITIIVVAAVGGAAYFLYNNPTQSSDTIKIGVLADLDGLNGKKMRQSIVLAEEQLNADGGILGKQIEVIEEDHNLESGLDMYEITSALTKLLTFHYVDFVIAQCPTTGAGLVLIELAAEHKKIILSPGTVNSAFQLVLDDYDRYKYYFSGYQNNSALIDQIVDQVLVLRENSGFNKVGYLAEMEWTPEIRAELDIRLPENGFELVYKGVFPMSSLDFSSYFAAAEAAGVEVLLPLIASDSGIPFVKEYYERESPLLVQGLISMAARPESWTMTDGKCEYIIVVANEMTVGYPVTSTTLPTRDAYFDRWGESIGPGTPYDLMRFILPDAIERAGTLETEAVIEALEKTSIETSTVENFVFTKSHCALTGENPNNPEASYMLSLLFQWQNGELLPVYPQRIMEEAGATYKFPPWPGPWDELD